MSNLPVNVCCKTGTAKNWLLGDLVVSLAAALWPMFLGNLFGCVLSTNQVEYQEVDV